MNSKGILFVASLFGVAAAVGCSSSSGGSSPSNEDGGGASSSGGSSTSSSSGGLPEASINLACMGGDCDGGACCAMVDLTSFSFSSACAASCTIGLTTPEFCKTTSDCPSGYTCGPNPLGMGPNICNAATSSSSSSGGSSSSSSSGGEAGTSSSSGGGVDASNG